MKLTGGLAEGQVLQRQGKRGATADLLGLAGTPGPVAATLRGPRGIVPGWKARPVGRAARGKFSARLAGIPAGGPYRLELAAGKETAAVREFFVGDVWLLAGQSNMEGCANRSGAARPHPLVRALTMGRQWRRAEEPLHLLAESPDACHNAGPPHTPAQAAAQRRKHPKGVGPALHFAREMVRRTGVPQGLVSTAHGGTSMTQWDPALKNQGGGSLYGSFLLSARAAGPSHAGILWYQGESDTNVSDTPLYTGRMRKLVAAARRDLRQPRLPWVTVQIARRINSCPAAEEAAWNSIQDQQRLLPRKIAALETVAAIDLPLDDLVHIGAGGVAALGLRLARAADRLVHGNRAEPPPPALRAVGQPGLEEATLSRIVDIAFDHVPGGLRAPGEPSGFALVDAGGNAYPGIYRAALRGNTVRLYLNSPLPNDIFVVYGHGTAPRCNIVDGRGMALPVFGPQRLGRPAAYLPFVTTWRTSGVVAATTPLGKITAPEVGDGAVKHYENPSAGFINEHAAWNGSSGHAYFASRIDLPEPMQLDVLAGYDGPFRLWIDRKPCLDALDGTNPCVPDEGRKAVFLPAGIHELTVAMDLNGGLAWGFFLRFRRRDVSPARIVSGDYPRPAYLA